MVNSVDEFYTLTLRQIELISPEIDVLLKEELKFNADIHGAKIKFNQGKTVQPDQSQFSEEASKKLDELATKDFEDRKAKWQNREPTN